MGQDDDLGFLGVKRYLFEDSPPVNEVGFGCGFAQTVDRDDFVFLLVVRTNCHEIVSLGGLKLHMSDIGLELQTDSKPL